MSSANKKRLYKPGPNIKDKIQSLKAAIDDRPPFCSGTVPLAANDLLLFYGKSTIEEGAGGASARRLDLTRVTDTEMQRLVDVCEVATFGKNHEEVLDPSYRSAWKLDPTHFATKLDVIHAGVMDSIRYNLLSGDQGKQTFYAELYKLNVYGKGSFSKPHKDTPRSEKMFGSLVVVLPIAHEGGTLIFRHKGTEWKIESDVVAPSSIVYVAFYGDVEHEVTEVKSGHRLTLTYNLYFGESHKSQAIVSTPTARTAALLLALPPNAESFQKKLSELLADDTFLPMGGRLGFGLFHEYPFESDPKLDRLAEVLKGNDAAIMQACRTLNLSCALNVCYEGGDHESRSVVLCSSVPELEGDLLMDLPLWEHLEMERKMTLANIKEEGEGKEEINLGPLKRYSPSLSVYVHWVTEQTLHNAFKSHSIAFGNEPSLSVDYGRICLIVSVGPPGNRAAQPVEI